jgi:hypothetical protein
VFCEVRAAAGISHEHAAQIDQAALALYNEMNVEDVGPSKVGQEEMLQLVQRTKL